MCIFGHKFGQIQSDGYQYCSKCGNAHKPHPCATGHIWADDSKQVYSHTEADSLFNGEFNIQYTTTKYYQKCTICGHRRSIEI